MTWCLLGDNQYLPINHLLTGCGTSTDIIQNQITVSLSKAKSTTDSTTITANNTETSTFGIGDEFMKLGFESSVEIAVKIIRFTDIDKYGIAGTLIEVPIRSLFG
jgi:hypothetical protein